MSLKFRESLPSALIGWLMSDGVWVVARTSEEAHKCKLLHCLVTLVLYTSLV
jgi:hypothetical protein